MQDTQMSSSLNMGDVPHSLKTRAHIIDATHTLRKVTPTNSSAFLKQSTLNMNTNSFATISENPYVMIWTINMVLKLVFNSFVLVFLFFKLLVRHQVNGAQKSSSRYIPDSFASDF